MKFENLEIETGETVTEAMNSVINQMNQRLEEGRGIPDKVSLQVGLVLSKDKTKRLIVCMETRIVIDDNPNFEKGQA